MSSLLYLFLIIVLLIAVVNDVKFSKIPNWLTFPSMIIWISFHTGFRGLEGLLFSLSGVGVGIAVFIIPYLFGGTGAGDVKLMGAVGALLGPKGVFIAFLATSIVGGIYALILLALHGYLKEALKRYGSIIKTFILTQKIIYIPPSKREQKSKLCYGVAIDADKAGGFTNLPFSYWSNAKPESSDYRLDMICFIAAKLILGIPITILGKKGILLICIIAFFAVLLNLLHTVLSSAKTYTLKKSIKGSK